jgi:hypothetical protein
LVYCDRTVGEKLKFLINCFKLVGDAKVVVDNRASSMVFSLAGRSLPISDQRLRVLEIAAEHLEGGLPHIAGDYMGEHWLATFAVLAVDEL